MKPRQLRLKLIRSLSEVESRVDFAIDPTYEADEILYSLLGMRRQEVLLSDEETDGNIVDKALSICSARTAGKPLAYQLGEVSFFGKRIEVSPGCLIPRADTEVLCEEIIARAPHGGIFWDLCTGTGCIPCTVLCHRQDLRAYAVELSDIALSTAQKNIKRYHLTERLVLLKGNVLEGMKPSSEQADLIVSNPPYIPTADLDSLDSQVHQEPRLALDGGPDGLTFYRAILDQYRGCLASEGCFLFEIGYQQETDIEKLAQEHGLSCLIRHDYSGNPRVAILT